MNEAWGDDDEYDISTMQLLQSWKNCHREERIKSDLLGKKFLSLFFWMACRCCGSGKANILEKSILKDMGSLWGAKTTQKTKQWSKKIYSEKHKEER